MTLTEAIKSGKMFRRPTWKPYLGQTTYIQTIPSGDIVFSNTHDKWIPRSEDLLANDWQLEEAKKEFTFSEILNAVKLSSDSTCSFEEFEQNLKVSLGFNLISVVSFIHDDEDTDGYIYFR